jgi:aspartyl-tRNA(Asn)/glutamyl-tRNA(Gln) amidotransferase subunit B
VERQRRILEDGGRVAQETRGWLDDRNVTVPQRSKEYAHDYRYFPEPDLPPLVITPAWVEEIRRRLPELAAQRKSRFIEQYGLSEYDARLLTGARALADFYEATVGLKQPGGRPPETFAKQVSNWVLGDLSRLLNLEGREITEARITPSHLAELIGLIHSGTLSVTMAKTVLEEAFASGSAPGKIVSEKGLAQISDSSVVESAVLEAIQANPKAVEDYRSGKETAARFLVGQVMKITRGQAKPELVQQLVRERLESELR